MCQVLEETFENGQKSNTKLVISRPESDRVTQLDIWRFRGEGLGGWVDGWVARWMPQSGDKGVGMVRIGPPPSPWSNHYHRRFDGNMVAGRRPAHIRHHTSWRNMVAGIVPFPEGVGSVTWGLEVATQTKIIGNLDAIITTQPSLKR